MPFEAAVPYVVPCLGCFAIGALFAFVDFHRSVTEQSNGTAPMSYLATWETNLFFTIIGLTSLGLFLISIGDPGGWFDKALALGTTNLYFRAGLIGIATNVLLRSKLIEVQGNKIGFEYLYDLFRGWSVNCYKAKASVRKLRIAREIANNNSNPLTFDDDLVAVVRDANNHRTQGVSRKLEEVLKKAEMLKLEDPVRYREILVRTAIDYTSIRAIKNWANGVQ